MYGPRYYKEFDKPQVLTDYLGNAVRSATEHNILGKKNSAIMKLKEEHANALLGPVHVRSSLPVNVEHTIDAVMAISDSKCATLVQNKTIDLPLCHVTKGVNGAPNEHEGDAHRTFVEIKDMIQEELVQRIFVFLFDVTKGMCNGSDLRGMGPDFCPLVIRVTEASPYDDLYGFVANLLHDLLVTGIVGRFGQRKGPRL